MRQVVVAEFLPEVFLDALRAEADVDYDPGLCSDRRRLLGAVADAEAILIRNRTRIDGELIAAAPALRVVGRLGVGLDNIDLGACERAGIAVKAAIGANSVSVAEYVMGAMLVLLRGVYGMTGPTIAGEWRRRGHVYGVELMGKTLGLVGLGSIARNVAARATAFGMRIVAHDPFVASTDPAWSAVESLPLRDVLADADVVSIHVPLTDATRDLIDATALAVMKPTAILINTARGGIVDEAALAEALRAGAIAGAALDVFDVEPIEYEAAARFAGLPNVLLTPHVAGNTSESVDRVAHMVVAAVLDVLRAPPG